MALTIAWVGFGRVAADRGQSLGYWNGGTCMADLKEVFKQAAEIAQQVPENMQEAAFNRALDLLTGKSDERHPTRRLKRTKHSRNRNVDQQSTKGDSTEALTPRKASKRPWKSSSGLSPKPAIVGLIGAGFFGVRKTLPAVRD